LNEDVDIIKRQRLNDGTSSSGVLPLDSSSTLPPPPNQLKSLLSENFVLRANISALWRTAKAEMRRREREKVDLVNENGRLRGELERRGDG